MSICIVDDFLTDQWASEVFDEIVGGKFLFNDYTVPNELHSYSGELAEKIQNPPQFVATYMYSNVLTDGSPAFLPYLFAGVFAAKTGINTTRILRCKANINLPIDGQTDGSFYTPHVDDPELLGLENFVTAIYYVNDSSGDTVFFCLDKNGELTELQRVTPKKNRLVYFDGSILHAGSPPISGKRIVLNMDFLSTFIQPKNEV